MEDEVKTGPMSLNAEHITREYGGLEGYHNSVSEALMALATVDSKLSAEAETEYVAILENHIAVLGGILLMGLEEMEPAKVIGLALKKGLLDDE